MSVIPVWVQVLQALLTPTVAIVAGFIGYRQWQTAHQKVMLDLFDRRMQVYDDITAMQRAVQHRGDKLQGHEIDHLWNIRSKARFLFGDDVVHELHTWHNLLIALTISADVLRLKGGSPGEHIPKITRALKSLRPYRERFPEIFQPYMLMDQRRSRKFSEYFAERNRIRLSYADEKQR